MTTLTAARKIRCEGSGSSCNPRAFGRGYFPSIKAKCPECGKWKDAQVTGETHGFRFGVIRDHTVTVR